MANGKRRLATAMGAVSAALTLCHWANRWIFGQVDGESRLNSIWRCEEHGDIAFTQVGKGKHLGRPILLVHGISIGAGASDWDENIAELSKNRTVYALDLPGFGNSHKENMTYNSYYYMRVINDFIRKIIGKRTDVIVMNVSSGFVLAGAAMEPELYAKVIVVNPYDDGVGVRTLDNAFVRRMLPLPIVGTAVYNYIASRQNILGFLDSCAPVTQTYAQVQDLMERQYENAHRYGVANKYAILCYLQGMLNTSIFRLMKNCPADLLVIVSGGSVMPLLEERDGLKMKEIKDGEFYPSIYAKERFMGIVDEFLGLPGKEDDLGAEE